ncbi:YbaB/EbfC family nucleoid-associated protein [Amycolatopsis sp. FBCC-B4732]|uniref:YbaB/EbfC family nucleoid-associated protein n=1 Tax=Amycolatopsis sp. FBCC-B4732 TaxID=3079339 RepID=UPI001FF1DD15|nr:YbaB/EbfC family nucleoid-associated protein [Amycolatopsis sp. FBCC-B4732]UOX86622.1 YbaB/EbfC family nucleoid-associated protein [Amycolatopsis sp. FBCC-B4732]
MAAEFDRLVTEFERFQSSIRDVDDRFAGLGAMQQELSELQASASSPDGGVTVVTGPGGAVLDVKFTDAALAKGPQALSAALMATLREAVGEAARRQAVLVQEHLGDELGLVDQVLETQAEAFGTTVEEMRSKLAEGTPSRERPSAPEDFSEERVLRQAGDAPPPPAPPASGGTAGESFLRNLFDEED